MFCVGVVAAVEVGCGVVSEVVGEVVGWVVLEVVGEVVAHVLYTNKTTKVCNCNITYGITRLI